MKRLIALTIALTALTGPMHTVFAKDKSLLQIEDEQKAQERDRIQKQYDAALKRGDRTAAVPAVNDPWANMRGSNDAKSNSKPKR